MTLSETVKKVLFMLLLCLSAFLSPAFSLLTGILMALIVGNPFPAFSKKASKIALQVSVVGLGFGMNLYESLEAGKEGMLMTIVSVTLVMCLGVVLGRILKVNSKSAYLISSGTAICGGSAIAAIGPVIEAEDDQMSVSLATIFILNAVALFLFPPIGQWLGLSQEQFGAWAAIAIHDTSSVVGAGAAFGEEALKVATTVKLTRALWIIPLALISSLIFQAKGRKVSVPWFILLFVLAMVFNSFLPLSENLTGGIVYVSRKLLCSTLFLIGGGLSLQSIRKVGAKPLVLGILLWSVISVVSLAAICLL